MPKPLIKIGILSFLSLVFSSFALAEESITITTYYPIPYGSYNELRAKRIAIGDNYINTTNYTWETTDGDGGEVDYLADLVVEGRVGIGTTTPTTPLHVVGTTSGAVRIVDGNQASGYVLTSDANGVGKWQAASSAVPATDNSSTMTLDSGYTYTVLCWATYFSCYDYATTLCLDGASVKTYTGANTDSEGCDQNTIMVKLTGVAAGSHTWSMTRTTGASYLTQQDYLWMAYTE